MVYQLNAKVKLCHQLFWSPISNLHILNPNNMAKKTLPRIWQGGVFTILFYSKNFLTLSIQVLLCGLCFEPPSTVNCSNSRNRSFCFSVSFTGVSITT